MQKLLIVHTGGGLGDVLLSTVVVEALKFNYPEAKIDFLARTSTSAALKGNPFINNILTLDKARLNWTEVIKWARKLRANSYEASIILWSNAPLAIMLYLAGIPIRVGQDSRFTYSWTYTHPVRVRSEHGDTRTHWSEIMLDFVRALRLPVPPVKPRFVISDQAKETAARLLQKLPPGNGPIIGIHPSKGISDPDKRWPTSVFASWIKDLHTELQARIFITGGPQETDLVAKIATEANIPCLNLAGQTDTEILAAAAQHCKVFICPDSGPAHLAAINGVPTLDICALKEDFPQRWRPIGAPTVIIRPERWICQRHCRKNQCPDFQCYKQISSQDICSGVKELLSKVEKEKIN